MKAAKHIDAVFTDCILITYDGWEILVYGTLSNYVIDEIYNAIEAIYESHLINFKSPPPVYTYMINISNRFGGAKVIGSKGQDKIEIKPSGN